MTAYHNSREKEYRAPFGAVRPGDAVSLAIDLLDMPEAEVVCRLWVDGEGETRVPMTREETGEGARFRCVVTPEKPELVWYSFIISCGGTETRYGAKRGRVGGEGELCQWEPPSFQITVYNERKAPDWYKKGIAYQIFPDRFCRGGDWRELSSAALAKKRGGPDRALCADWYETPRYEKDGRGRVTRWDFYGGTLSGIEEKLPYLRELGVTALYLNPIFEAASNHRYDTGDYTRVDAMLGGEGSFERLAKKAGEHGISIILDGVFNHTGCDSVYFNKYGNYPTIGAVSENSPYRAWYRFGGDGEYGSWWGVDDLPDADEENPDYRDFIFGVARRWLRAGAKGWRLDVADELPDDFIAGIKTAVTEELGGEGLLLGEVWEDASNKISYGKLRRYLLGDELDCAMNYPLRDAALAFVLGKQPAEELLETLLSLYENYPREAFYSALNLIGSHDRPRILTLLGGAPEESTLTDAERADFRLDGAALGLAKARLWLMALLQMTLPGVPCIYYGDEAGMQGYSDPYNRAAYPWGREDKDTAEIYRNAIALRRLLPVFTDGDFELLPLGGDVFGFARKTGDVCAAVLVNRSVNESREARFSAHAGRASELVGGLPVALEGETASVTLPPLGSAVVLFGGGDMAKPMPRGTGVLCHISSLPNDGGPGNMDAAFDFVDALADAGLSYWQLLPLNPTDKYGSPYAGASAFAGNTALLSISEPELRESFRAFSPDAEYEGFCRENGDWLTPYALFTAIRERYPGRAWRDWPEKYRRFAPSLSMDAALAEGADFAKYCQYVFFTKWRELRRHANSRGVLVIGDMPMYVSADSADVWAAPECFALDAEGRVAREAGVPPDRFAAEGQLWGSPVFDWDAMARDGYDWWMRRLKQAFGLYDFVRLDHFRGFEAFWSTPSGQKASAGRWVPGPGMSFFSEARARFGRLPVIAEDLGSITPGVRALTAYCGFPGMDVLQFYDGDARLGYCPPAGKIAYTGTHDNETLLGWCAGRYPDADARAVATELTGRALASGAGVVILPLQDVLGLGNEARMNTPGVAGGNWQWQAQATREELRRALRSLPPREQRD